MSRPARGTGKWAGRKGTAWVNARKAVLVRDGFRCQIGLPGCTIIATCVDHIRPLAEGGAPLDPSNLRGACRRCNGARGVDVSSNSRKW